MSDHVFLNADRTAVVSEFDGGKKWQVSREFAASLGLLKDEKAVPQTRRNQAFDATAAKAPPTKRAPRKRK